MSHTSLRPRLTGPYQELTDAEIALAAFVMLATFVVASGGEPANAFNITYVVNSTADDDDGSCQPLTTEDCTLREAMNLANADDGNPPDTIEFDIPGDGVHRIVLQTPLPAIREPLVIAGHTQGTATGAFCPATRNILIEISGEDLLTLSNGLTIDYRENYSVGTAIRGLSIINFEAYGIAVLNDDIHNVQCNNIGLAADGITSQPNGDGGVFLGPELGATSGFGLVNIGRITGSSEDPAAVRNVISGNGGTGINIQGGDVNVRGNYIGLNAAGTAALGNSGEGILVSGGTDIEIGGPVAADGNVISGQNTPSRAGIFIDDVSGVRVFNNRIGTNAAGTAAVPNRDGIVTSAPFTFIGTAGAGNLISGNTTAGVVFERSTQSSMEDNLAGTDADGDSAIPNGMGVSLFGAENTSIFGGANSPNVISGNISHGIVLNGPTLQTNIAGNLIGYAADGITPLPNGGNGVHILSNVTGSPSGGTIGGSGLSANGFYIRTTSDGNGVNITQTPGQPVAAGFLIGQNFFDTDGLGIDLRNVTDAANTTQANDVGDVDTGPNNFQNHPVINSAVAGDSPSIEVTLTSKPNTNYNLYFYASSTCSEGHRTGERPLAGVSNGSVVMNVFGTGTSTATYTSLGGFSAGDFITVVAQEHGALDTSEFSPCFQATGDSGPAISTLEPSAKVAGSSAFQLRVLGSGFSPSDDIYWNGVEVSTTFEDVNELVATINKATLGNTAGTATVAVGPNSGNLSNEVLFTIQRSSSDVNCDGTATAADALFLLRIVAGLDEPQAGCSADVIGFNGVHLDDLLWLRRDIAGLVEPLPSSTP